MSNKMIVALAVADWMKEEADASALDYFYADAEMEAEHDRFMVEDYQWEQEHPDWEDKTIAWLSDPANYEDENYSDIYKEVYGVRPHWLWE